MEHIVELLDQKNKHLERFLEGNEREIVHFHDGNFEGLESFYKAREVLLDMISRVDSSIEEANLTKLNPAEVPDQLKKAMIQALDKKNDLVTQILSQDLQILSLIEEAKSSLIREMKDVGSVKKALGSYRSGEPESSFDEKA